VVIRSSIIENSTEWPTNTRAHGDVGPAGLDAGTETGALYGRQGGKREVIEVAKKKYKRVRTVTEALPVGDGPTGPGGYDGCLIVMPFVTG
jgi:hypothetical protein